MADQNLPGYQRRKVIDTGYVKDLSFQGLQLIESEMSAFCNCCSNVVTADLL